MCVYEKKIEGDILDDGDEECEISDHATLSCWVSPPLFILQFCLSSPLPSNVNVPFGSEYHDEKTSSAQAPQLWQVWHGSSGSPSPHHQVFFSPVSILVFGRARYLGKLICRIGKHFTDVNYNATLAVFLPIVAKWYYSSSSVDRESNGKERGGNKNHEIGTGWLGLVLDWWEK